MTLNTIILPYNKILEVEECEPVSSPSSTSFEEHKSVPDLNLLYSPFFKNYNLPLEISAKKNRSSPPSIDYKNYQEFYFKTNNNENTSMFSQKNISNINNLYIDQEIKNNNKDNSKNEKNPFQQYNYYSARENQNPFQRAKNLDKFDENESESSENPFSYSNLRKNHRESEIIDQNKLNRIYDNYINNPKISPVKEDRQIDSFMEEMSNLENKFKNMNSEDKNISINKKDISKAKPKNNQMSKINIPSNYNYRNSNPNPVIKNGIYCKKKITDSNIILGKKGKKDEKLSIDSSIKSQTNSEREIKTKKRPLILNVNLKKKNFGLLNISQFQKIKSDGLFYILRFLDYYDIINLFKTKNKQLCILINTALVNVYYFNIKESLMRYCNFLELLKCTIVQSKIKETLKIDFVMNFRFVNNNSNKKLNNYKYRINLNDSNNKFIEPLYLQFGYIYNYFQKVKNKKELITKEEYEKQIKRLRMYDYYTFDLYPENNKNNKNNNNILKKPIFISKELSLFEKDGNNSIVNIQPILPFGINDKGIINLEIYTTNNGFIDPDSIKISIKSYNLKKYIKMLDDKGINNPRISECEGFTIHWKNINLYQYHKSLVLRLKKIFEPFFEIKNILFGNIGVFIFKVDLKAIKSGEINDKNKLEIKIKIKEEKDYIENEIRKNNLLFERRDIFELRVGDQFLYYFSLK